MATKKKANIKKLITKNKTKFVRTISINLCRNDPVDVRCGGAPILGFDYTIESGEYRKAMKVIKDELEAQETEPISISSTNRRKVVSSTKTWTPIGIRRNMRKEFRDWLLSEYRRSGRY